MAITADARVSLTSLGPDGKLVEVTMFEGMDTKFIRMLMYNRLGQGERVWCKLVDAEKGIAILDSDPIQTYENPVKAGDFVNFETGDSDVVVYWIGQ